MEAHKIKFRPMVPEDWESVAEIYRQGIETVVATFEQEVPDWETWNGNHLKTCRLVAEIEKDVAGWAALSLVSERCVYAGVGEVSVYISEKYRGMKIGLKLLEQLILESENIGLWTLQAGIFPTNTASIKIHEKAGFRKIGFREKIGQLNGKWQDTVLYERRSNRVGIN